MFTVHTGLDDYGEFETFEQAQYMVEQLVCGCYIPRRLCWVKEI